MSQPPFRSERRMHERLAEVLAHDILAGTIEQGAFFPSSDDLVREYGVSRTVARETIQALAGAGLIAVQHGKRSTVADAEHWRLLDPLIQTMLGTASGDQGLLRDMWETRRSVEPTAARLCAERASDAELQRLVALAERALRASGEWSDAERAHELLRRDWAFHNALATASGNRVLAGIVRDTHRSVHAVDQLADASSQLVQECLEQHLAIARAVARRDADEAVELLSRHLAWAQPFDDEDAPPIKPDVHATR